MPQMRSAPGVESRDRAEHYVRVTVLLAAVLFLIALGQRFKFPRRAA